MPYRKMKEQLTIINNKFNYFDLELNDYFKEKISKITSLMNLKDPLVINSDNMASLLYSDVFHSMNFITTFLNSKLPNSKKIIGTSLNDLIEVEDTPSPGLVYKLLFKDIPYPKNVNSDNSTYEKKDIILEADICLMEYILRVRLTLKDSDNNFIKSFVIDDLDDFYYNEEILTIDEKNDVFIALNIIINCFKCKLSNIIIDNNPIDSDKIIIEEDSSVYKDVTPNTRTIENLAHLINLYSILLKCN